MNKSKFPEQCCTIDFDQLEEKRLVSMFKAIGNPIRFEIIKFLSTHPGCITGDIVEVVPVAQATVSQHLKELKTAGWIDGELSGTSTCYELNRNNVSWFSEKMGQMF